MNFDLDQLDISLNSDLQMPIVLEDPDTNEQIDLHNYDLIFTFRAGKSNVGTAVLILCTDHSKVATIDSTVPYELIQINPDGTGMISLLYSKAKTLQEMEATYDVVLIDKNTSIRERANGPTSYGYAQFDLGDTRWVI